MTLPASTPIELNEILTEFGAPAKTPLSAMVRGGDYVPADDISGENSGIPTSTPIKLSDFLSANGNPNPYQIKNEVLTPSPNGNVVVRVLSHNGQGIFVAAHDATSTVPAAAQFVIDAKFRLGTSAITEPSSGTITTTIESYQNLNRVMSFWIGLTPFDPATSSALTMYNSLVGWHVELFDTEEAEGIGFVKLGNPTTGSFSSYMQNDGYLEDASGDYETVILPSTSNYVNFRFERGEPTNGISGSSKAADWICTVYENDDWTTVYDTEPAANGAHNFNTLYANQGGYLIMAIDSGHPSGNLQLDIGDLRVYAGSQTPPW